MVVGFTASFEYSASTDTLIGTTIVQSIWDFGDGSPLEVAGDSVQHVFTSPGIFWVVK